MQTPGHDPAAPRRPPGTMCALLPDVTRTAQDQSQSSPETAPEPQTAHHRKEGDR